ncbi:MAG: glycosyltransferase [Cyanobacteria bacterium P01_D01_bin.105]
MKILFLDQSGKLGGAELCLADIAQPFGQSSLVGVFADGDFPAKLRQLDIPVKVLTEQTLRVQKASGLLAGLKSLAQLWPLISTVVRLSRSYDLIYANTQKALVVGAIASFLGRRPFVYHLHDIVSAEHFSATNRQIIITLANRAALVIANSYASRDAFISAGGSADKLHVVYNGFAPEAYIKDHQRKTQEESKTQSEDEAQSERSAALRQGLVSNSSFSESGSASPNAPFIVGHFSRLSPWKGQHVLIEALQHCPDNVVALLIGDALFGEEAYVQQLHQQVKRLNLEHRVKFLGFRTDVPDLMAACDLVAHTSTASEPFGRVIVEAMLCGRPVVAAAAGGAMEIVEHGTTGWLTPPGNAAKLADIITTACIHPTQAATIAQQGQMSAQQRFSLTAVNAQINGLLNSLGTSTVKMPVSQHL